MTRIWRSLVAVAAGLLLLGLGVLAWVEVTASAGWIAYAPSSQSYRMVWVSPGVWVLGWGLAGVGFAGLCALLGYRSTRRRAGRR